MAHFFSAKVRFGEAPKPAREARALPGKRHAKESRSGLSEPSSEQGLSLSAGMTDRSSRHFGARTSIDIARVGDSAAPFGDGCAGRGLDLSFSRSATRQDVAREDNETKLSDRSFHLTE